MSLIECPACSKLVDASLINVHLDANCQDPKPAAEAKAPARVSRAPAKTNQTTLFDFGKKKTLPGPAPASSPTSSAAPLRPGPSASPVTETPAPAPAPSSSVNVLMHSAKRSRKEEDLTLPLAELARPKSLEDFLGQEKVVGEDSLLRDLIEAGKCPSLLLWGGPGCGKTTLARLIGSYAPFYRELSAVKDNMNDIKSAMERAVSFKRMHPEENRQPVLFIDEIHRLNKAQQDVLLPTVERGDFTLVAATTENPSFRIISALLSRCRTVVLQSLAVPVLEQILARAAELQAKRLSVQVEWEENVIHRLAAACDGDARSAINAVQMVIEATLKNQERKRRKLEETRDESSATIAEGDQQPNDAGSPDDAEAKKLMIKITAERVLSALQKSHLLYDQTGDGHYDTISALHKSIRGSDADAALYWMGRMLFAGEDPLFICRRLIRCASEDIGLADPQALTFAVSTWQACTYIGMPEAGVCIGQLVVYLARAPKSVEVYKALNRVQECVNSEVAYPVPLHLRNAPTSLMKDLGYAAGYKYNPDYEGPVEQDYFPPELKGRKFL